jgi:hypothetical protein
LDLKIPLIVRLRGTKVDEAKKLVSFLKIEWRSTVLFKVINFFFFFKNRSRNPVSVSLLKMS